MTQNDKELDELVARIVETYKTTKNVTDTACIRKHYNEILIVLESRAIKTLAESLTENGFAIKQNSLGIILRRIGNKNSKKNGNIKQDVDLNKSTPVLNKTEKNKQDIISDNQVSINSESLLSPEEQAKKYFTQKPLIRNKENKS